MAKTVLVVDDSNFVRRVIVKSIKEYSEESELTIKEASSGLEALDILKESLPEIMFLDLTMPIMDGYQLLDELEKNSIKLPIVVISGDVQNEAKKSVIDKGVLGFLNKPFKKDEWQELMKEIKILWVKLF